MVVVLAVMLVPSRATAVRVVACLAYFTYALMIVSAGILVLVVTQVVHVVLQYTAVVLAVAAVVALLS